MAEPIRKLDVVGSTTRKEEERFSKVNNISELFSSRKDFVLPCLGLSH
jgi:hypothetical protein